MMAENKTRYCTRVLENLRCFLPTTKYEEKENCVGEDGPEPEPMSSYSQQTLVEPEMG